MNFGKASTTDTLTLTGSDPYTMSCSVSGSTILGVPGPTGAVALSDVTTGTTLATGVPLGTPSQSVAVEMPFATTVALQSALHGYSTLDPVMVAGDFNGDGIPDLILFSSQFEFLAGNGDGTFQAPVTLNNNFFHVYAAATADFNGDGILDLAVSQPDLTTGAMSLYIYLGNGDGPGQARAPGPGRRHRPQYSPVRRQFDKLLNESMSLPDAHGPARRARAARVTGEVC